MRQIYFMTCGAFTKVGIAGDPTRRLAQMQGGNPHEIILHETSIPVPLNVARRVESATHYVMASRRVRGEWFAVSVDVACTVVEQVNKAVNRGGEKFLERQGYHGHLDDLRRGFDDFFAHENGRGAP